MDKREKERSLQQAQWMLLLESKFHDVTLISHQDGMQVTANRAMLAARSAVFEKMLFGAFQEATQSTIEVAYSGKVMEAIVRYICTNNARALDEIGCEASTDQAVLHQLLLPLAEASSYYELPLLRQNTCRCVERVINQSVLHAVSLLAYNDEVLPLPEQYLIEHAYARIRDSVEALLKDAPSDEDGDGSKQCSKSSGLKLASLLSAARIERLLQDDQVRTEELTLFSILHAWADGCDRKSREEVASNLTRYIHFDRIHPRDLDLVVMPTCLVRDEALASAGKANAVLKEGNDEKRLLGCRFNSTWRSSRARLLSFPLPGSSEHQAYFDSVTCMPKLELGRRHAWRIRIVSFVKGNNASQDYIQLGVAPSNFDWPSARRRGHILGAGNAWGWSGYLWHRCKIVRGHTDPWPHRFKAGDTIVFELDLTGSGTLRVSIDGGPPDQLFDDMLKDLDEQEKSAGLVPAVSFYNGYGSSACLEFLGFETPHLWNKELMKYKYISAVCP